MELSGVVPGTLVHHDLKNSFGVLLEAALHGCRIGVAHGPLYLDDPAASLMEPFTRSAKQTGWKIETERQLAPGHVLETARGLRVEAAARGFNDLVTEPRRIELLDDWARAGLVLEVASRRGINVVGRGLLHVRWKLVGTVTGRFGAETIHSDPRHPGEQWAFNPLTVPRGERHRIVPNGKGRSMVSIDFRAMDLWSMLAVVPDLAKRYGTTSDPHGTTASLLFDGPIGPEERAIAKKELFVHAYGGFSPLRGLFESKIPELGFLRSLPHGEGARLIQRTSAIAFRAGMSRALDLLIYDEVRPVMAVHDELVLDVLDGFEGRVMEIAHALELGAQARVGQPYRTGLTGGDTYEACKTESVRTAVGS